MSARRTEVSGIPTLLAPRTDGRCVAGLVVRVGEADETLALRGVTRLVERIGLRSCGAAPTPGLDGLADVLTRFTVAGTPDEVGRALGALSSALRNPPAHLVEQERAAAAHDERRRGAGPTRIAPMVRWGARGRGLRSYPLVGLPALDGEVVSIWAQAAFTRDNAVLWVSGELPRGLDLTLPEGDRQPVPADTPVLSRTPAWYPGGGGTVHVTALLPRSAPTEVHTHVLDRVLDEELVRTGAASAARAWSTPHDADTELVEVLVEGPPERRDALGGAVVDALARVRWGRLGAADRSAVDTAVAAATRAPEDPERLAAEAADLLLGRAAPAPEEHVAALRSVTADEVRAAAEAFHATALAQVPGGGLDWAGFAAVPSSSSAAVPGREYPAREGGRAVLLVGPEGVSLRSGTGVVTVRFDQVAAMESFADGGRWLVGTDGFRVHVEPTVFEVDGGVVGHLDAAVDPARVVRLPGRPADQLPRPLPSSSDPAPAHRGPSARLTGVFRGRRR